LKMEETARRTYAEAVLERFCNPYIRHELLSISLNSVSKWKVRVLPSLLDYLDANQKLPSALTFSLAALIRFYRGTAISETEFRGVRNNEPYPINDDRAILEFFERSWAKFSNDYRALAGAVLANHAFWGIDLTGICGLTDAVAAHLQAIDTLGAHGAAASILPQ